MKKIIIIALFAIVLFANIEVVAQENEGSRKSCGTLTLQQTDLPFASFNMPPASEILLYIRFEATTVTQGADNAGTFRSSIISGIRNLPAPNLSAVQKDEIVQRVQSDFSPFNIRVTTDFNEFLAYPSAFREMALVTTTPTVAGFSSGIVGISPFAGDRIPNAMNFTFSSFLGDNPIDVAATISHETGHLFGLEHQHLFSTTSCSILVEYHPGFGSGRLRFNPIMGNGIGDSIYNWFAQSCPTRNLGIPQNDYARINLSVQTRPDDFPNTPQPGLSILGSNEVIGVLEQGSDADVIFFNFSSSHSVTVSSHNIDLRVSLLSESGQVLEVFSDPLDRNIVIPQIVGPKYLKIEAESNVNMSSQFMTGTYNVTSFAPTAANASISGRILTGTGNGIRNVNVSLVRSNGEVFSVRTGTFGYYKFEDLEVGQIYILSVNSKRFTFSNPTRIISLNEDLTDADFIADSN